MSEKTALSPGPASRVPTGITTGDLARRLGVSPTTVRSWDRRYGIGPAVRLDGTHRRWAPGDVAVLEEMCRLTAAGTPPAEAARAARASGGTPPPRPPVDAAAPAPGDVRREYRGVVHAAARLDGPALEALLAGAVTAYGAAAAWEDVMVPALHAVGRTWESSGDLCVEVEHLLSWHVSTALRRAPGSERRGPGSPVLLACVPAERHTLPLEALAAGLAERGLPLRMFGAAVPAEALDAAVRRTGPAAVTLWSQTRSTADHALAGHVAATGFGLRGARTAPLVLLAGPGWAGRNPPPGAVRPAGLREALELLTQRCGARSGDP
ncbi:MerR family transcriptional regulator [Streptomyces hydrogenans]|uniref:MerR family transcriptional regulator n=2 Tax=Streptomyces hydrogenans TaxID=1873719 RepID=UPI0033D5DDDE